MDENRKREVSEQHGLIEVAKETDALDFKRNSHPDATWFRDAGLGLFITWGLSSVQGQGDLSWSMIKNRMGKEEAASKYGLCAVQKTFTPIEYWKQAEHFAPEKFDPCKILAAAKAAGARYAVLVAKHHDGFALWPSAHGDFNTKLRMNGRDLVKEYVEACRANGMKAGLYYSPPDWRFNKDYMSFNYIGKKPELDVFHKPIQGEDSGTNASSGKATQESMTSLKTPESHAAAFKAYVKGQVEELLTKYGKVDLLWFDGNVRGAFSVDWLRQLQPGIVVNNRGFGRGDFYCDECCFPERRRDGWWEYCHILNDGAWGYLEHETYKPLGWLVSELAKARSWNGNFLFNVGPDAHGELPEAYYKRMKQLEKWMNRNSESIFDVEGSHWPEKANVPVTRKGKRLFAHVEWLFEGGDVVIEDIGKPLAAHSLSDGAPVDFEWKEMTLRFRIEGERRSNVNDVVEILLQ